MTATALAALPVLLAVPLLLVPEPEPLDDDPPVALLAADDRLLRRLDATDESDEPAEDAADEADESAEEAEEPSEEVAEAADEPADEVAEPAAEDPEPENADRVVSVKVVKTDGRGTYCSR